ncbi:MAG: hypothetical protein WC421_06255 [Elusimicrobiales bacterium]
MKRTGLLAAAALCVSAFAQIGFATDYYWDTWPGGTRPAYVDKTKQVDINAFLPWTSGGSARAMGMGGAVTAAAEGLEAVEYNPAGLAKVKHVEAELLTVMNHSKVANDNGSKETKNTVTPTLGGVALKVGPLALGLSMKKPYFTDTYLKYGSMQYTHAPDDWTIAYKTLSDQMDVSNLNTYALTGALSLGRLDLGVNLNYIKGDATRTVRGQTSDSLPLPNANSQFKSVDTVNFKGYTADIGAMLNLGVLTLGASGKNIVGSVDTTERYLWRDNFDVGSGNWFVYDPVKYHGASTKTITKFAPTYSFGAALGLGKVLTIDADYQIAKLDAGNKTLGKLGAELWVIPGFLAARGGIQNDFTNMADFVDRKSAAYFLGAGVKIFALTVDASVSLASAEAAQDGGSFTGALSAQLKF